jgi:hypothetical protein
MKLGSLIAGSVLSLFAFTANADIDVINSTSSVINAIYISDSEVDDWEENVIEGEVINPGETLHVKVNIEFDKFDLRVESTEGGYEDYFDFPGNATVINLKGNGQSQYK